MFHAYIHARPDGTPFYVGKGGVRRVKNISRPHNKHHTNIVNKYGIDNILVAALECSSDEISFELEKGLIKRLKLDGVTLVNQTDGGPGWSGANHKKESKGKVGDALRGRVLSEERCIQISRAHGGTSVRAIRGEQNIIFPTLSAACRSLGLKLGNVSYALQVSSGSIKVTRPQLSESQRTQIDGMAESGLNGGEISRRLGLPKTTVYRHLRRKTPRVDPLKGWKFERVEDD